MVAANDDAPARTAHTATVSRAAMGHRTDYVGFLPSGDGRNPPQAGRDLDLAATSSTSCSAPGSRIGEALAVR